MLVQFPPDGRQRRHWYAKVIGCVPDHVPAAAVSVRTLRKLDALAHGRSVTGS